MTLEPHEDGEHAHLTEVLKDAESCARLSQWEEEFLEDMRAKVLIHGAAVHLSDKQWQIVRRIEEKVYA